MIGCSKERFSLKSSFAVLISLHICRASLQGARHSWYNFSSGSLMVEVTLEGKMIER